MKTFWTFSVALFGYIAVQVHSQSEHLRPGHASQTHSCNHVRAVPQELLSPDVMRPKGLDASFYKKYTEAYGIPILGSAQVKDEALMRACYTVRFLFAGHSGVREVFYKLGGRFAIMSETEVTLDIPEHSSLDPYMNDRARGLGGTLQGPLTTGAEENVLCYKTDRYFNEDIFLHESAHAVELIGALVAIPDHMATRDRDFQHASTTGLWRNTYAISNAAEYWAEGVQSYFDVNAEGPKNGDSVHNDVNTRAELQTYDPQLFRLIQTVFPCNNRYLKRCESTRDLENQQTLQMNCNTDNIGLQDILGDSSCSDTLPISCIGWAAEGECQKNPGYMLSQCKRSCHVCSPANSACTDSNVSCAGWAAKGECQNNPNYMLPNCKRSCQQCGT